VTYVVVATPGVEYNPQRFRNMLRARRLAILGRDKSISHLYGTITGSFGQLGWVAGLVGMKLL